MITIMTIISSISSIISSIRVAGLRSGSVTAVQPGYPD